MCKNPNSGKECGLFSPDGKALLIGECVECGEKSWFDYAWSYLVGVEPLTKFECGACAEKYIWNEDQTEVVDIIYKQTEHKLSIFKTE